MLETTRTYVARITNHEQVRDSFDQCGFSASKLWNVGRYYIQERWDDDGEKIDTTEEQREAFEAAVERDTSSFLAE